MDREGWTRVFEQLKEDDILWKLPWWWDEEIIFCYGTYPNIPLMSPRRCINNNPIIALKQLAFVQTIPSEDAIKPIYFLHTETNKVDESRKITQAWKEVIYKGKVQLK